MSLFQQHYKHANAPRPLRSPPTKRARRQQPPEEYARACNKDNTWSYDKELQCEDTVKCSMGDLYEYGVQTIGRPKDKYVSPGFEIQVMCAGLSDDTKPPTEEYTATCVDDGSWEFSPELNCAIVCHIHELKKFGVWPSFQPENKYIKPGQEIKVMCHDTDGPDYAASCNKDGSWSFDPELQCQEPEPLQCSYKDLQEKFKFFL